MSLQLNEVGAPVITRKGELVIIDEFDSFKQRIWNLFNTQVGTHFSNPNFGFNAIAMKTTDIVDVERALYSYSLETLTPENVMGMDSLKYLDVIYTDGTGFIDIVVMSEYGQRYKNTLEVNTSEF